MSEERLAAEVREAFDEDYEANRGLEDRVMAAIPWEEPRRRTLLARARRGGALATVLALVVVVILVAPTVLTRLDLTFPGSGGGGEPPAYSLAAVSGGSLFVVQRGAPPENALLQSPDGGRTWIDRLHFKGVYDGMQMFGQDGFMWSFDWSFPPCSSEGCGPASSYLLLYQTSDGGTSWTRLAKPEFPVNGVFFTDRIHGWLDLGSGSPSLQISNDALFATEDGGVSWHVVGELPHSGPTGWVYGVGMGHLMFSSDSSRGWFIGDGKLFTSADRGQSWAPVVIAAPKGLEGWTVTPSQPVLTGPEGLLPVSYRNPAGADNATANRIYVYPTHDGGATWGEPRAAPVGFAPVGDFLSVTILDSKHVWLTSQSLTGGDNVQVGPAVARTTDGALSWTVTHDTPRILQMMFRDATHGFALDVTGEHNVNGILSTSDAGATWDRVTVRVFG